MPKPNEVCGAKRNLKRSGTNSTIMDTYYYAVTLKPNYEKDNDYNKIESTYAEFFTLDDELEFPPSWEIDSSNKMHMHFTIKRTKPIRFVDYMKKGWHIFFKRLNTEKDRVKWLAYCKKCNNNIPELVIEHNNNKEYGFQNDEGHEEGSFAQSCIVDFVKEKGKYAARMKPNDVPEIVDQQAVDLEYGIIIPCVAPQSPKGA